MTNSPHDLDANLNRVAKTGSFRRRKVKISWGIELGGTVNKSHED